MLGFIQAIMVALIAGSCSVLGVIISSKRQHETTIQELRNDMETMKIELNNKIEFIKQGYDSTVIVIQNDIKALEKKQDKHNNLIERMYAVEKVEELLEEKLKVANHRLDDLEREGK